jgi:hypothetical protein
MSLSHEQLMNYNEQGFLLLSGWLTENVVEEIRAQIPSLIAKDSENKLLESSGRAVRAVHGCHLENEVMRRLTCHPRLLEPVTQLLQSDVYVYQFKINLKSAFEGESWPWHQDFKHWYEEDGLPEPRALSVGVYLDDVTSFNGPLFVVPGSHRDGDQSAIELRNDGWSAKYRADIKYTLRSADVKRLIEHHGITSTEGPKGSVLFFDVNVAHASSGNVSPFDRWLLIITYNSVSNVPQPKGEPRPEFLVGKDRRPLVSVPW